MKPSCFKWRYAQVKYFSSVIISRLVFTEVFFVCRQSFVTPNNTFTALSLTGKVSKMKDSKSRAALLLFFLLLGWHCIFSRVFSSSPEDWHYLSKKPIRIATKAAPSKASKAVFNKKEEDYQINFGLHSSPINLKAYC